MQSSSLQARYRGDIFFCQGAAEEHGDELRDDMLGAQYTHAKNLKVAFGSIRRFLL